MEKQLFKPDATKLESRSSLAADEAVKTKKCLQALRYLWRNAKENSHDPQVQILKDYLCPSPIQAAHAPPAPDSDSEPEPQEAIVEYELGAEGGESEEEQPDEEVDPDQVTAPTKSGRVVQQAIRKESDFGSDSDDSINAPTLMLGDESPKGNHDGEEAEDLRDSQVGGWLGSFYAAYGKYGKGYDPNAPKSVLENNHDAILSDIHNELKGLNNRNIGEQLTIFNLQRVLFRNPPLMDELICLFPISTIHCPTKQDHTSLPRHPMIYDYLAYCSGAMERHGPFVYSLLKTSKHFYEWLAEEKSQDRTIIK